MTSFLSERYVEQDALAVLIHAHPDLIEYEKLVIRFKTQPNFARIYKPEGTFGSGSGRDLS